MNREDAIRQIRKKAKDDAEKRQDLRFLETMGFLIAKGFLRTNLEIRPAPNKHLRIEDVLWAGQTLEPRILEVLPAAVLRFGKHFDLNPEKHLELARVIEQLKKGEEGEPFFGVPFTKIKTWVSFDLPDRRVKPLHEKKIPKTFRLSPAAIRNLQNFALGKNCSETQILEDFLTAAIKKP